jgi:hypothetical protein
VEYTRFGVLSDGRTDGIIAVGVYLDPDYVRSQAGLERLKTNGAAIVRVPLRDPNTRAVSWHDYGQSSDPAFHPRPGLEKYEITTLDTHTFSDGGGNPILDLDFIAEQGLAVRYSSTLGDLWLQQKDGHYTPAAVDCESAQIAAMVSQNGDVTLSFSGQCATSAKREVYFTSGGVPTLLPFARVEHPQATETFLLDPARMNLNGQVGQFIVHYMSTVDYSEAFAETNTQSL